MPYIDSIEVFGTDYALSEKAEFVHIADYVLQDVSAGQSKTLTASVTIDGETQTVNKWRMVYLEFTSADSSLKSNGYRIYFKTGTMGNTDGFRVNMTGKATTGKKWYGMGCVLDNGTKVLSWNSNFGNENLYTDSSNTGLARDYSGGITGLYIYWSSSLGCNGTLSVYGVPY